MKITSANFKDFPIGSKIGTVTNPGQQPEDNIRTVKQHVTTTIVGEKYHWLDVEDKDGHVYEIHSLTDTGIGHYKI